jgi:hypothetical protein
MHTNCELLQSCNTEHGCLSGMQTRTCATWPLSTLLLPALVCLLPDFSKHAKQPGANILLELAPIMKLCLDNSGV